MSGLLELLWRETVPDHRLNEAVDLDVRATLVDLGQRVPTDLANDPAEHHLFL